MSATADTSLCGRGGFDACMPEQVRYGFSRDAGPDTGQTDGFLLSARSRLGPRTFRCAPSFVAATPRSTVRRK